MNGPLDNIKASLIAIDGGLNYRCWARPWADENNLKILSILKKAI